MAGIGLGEMPLMAAGLAKGGMGKLPVGTGKAWCPEAMGPDLAPPLLPAELEGPELVAVQKTLATICEGVMPTTGTLALGYVMLLARAGM